MFAQIQTYLPLAPFNWTSILHYLLLIGAIGMLFASGDAPMPFIIVMLILALLIAASLYVNFLPFGDRIFVFLIRIGIFAVPLILAGMGPNEASRQAAVFLTLLAAPLLVITLMGCYLPAFADPRIAFWCAL